MPILIAARRKNQGGWGASLAFGFLCILICAAATGAQASGGNVSTVSIRITYPEGQPLESLQIVVEEGEEFDCILSLLLESTRIEKYTVRLLADDAFVPFVLDGKEMDRLECKLVDGRYQADLPMSIECPPGPGTHQMAWTIMGEVMPPTCHGCRPVHMRHGLRLREPARRMSR